MPGIIYFLAGCLCFLSFTFTNAAKKSCDTLAMECATSRENDIVSNREVFNFDAACDAYKGALDCLSKLSKNTKYSDCTAYNQPTSFSKAKGLAYDYSHRMCGVDGSLSGCAYDLTNCLALKNEVDNALKLNDDDATCKSFITFSDCAELIKDRMICPADTEKYLTDSVDNLKQALTMTCFKSCDMALQMCESEGPAEDLSLDLKMTEEEQEVICSEVNAARNCLDDAEIEAQCVQENRQNEFQEAVKSKQKDYDDYCSAPARTCTAEIKMCLYEVDITLNSKSSSEMEIEDIKQFCTSIYDAIDCVNVTSGYGFCRGKEGARILSDALHKERGLVDTYCGVAQCRVSFPKCYELITAVSDTILNSDNKPSCQEIDETLECISLMVDFPPCFELEFENVTFENAKIVLNEFNQTECEAPVDECSPQIEKCTSDVDAKSGDFTVKDVDKIEEGCKSVGFAIDCIDNIRGNGYCEGNTGANLISTAHTVQSNLRDMYCGESQCRASFDTCTNTIAAVKDKLFYGNEKPSCQEINSTLQCIKPMREFDPCLNLRIGNITFEDVILAVNNFSESECGPDNCQNMIPQCYYEVLKDSTQFDSCTDAEQQLACVQQMLKIEQCPEVNEKKWSESVQKATQRYLQQRCGAGSSQLSLLALAATLVLSTIFNKK